MKSATVVIASILALCAAIPVAASIIWNVETVGAARIYSYTYTNTEEPSDIITGIHVYAPVDASLVSAWQADEGWQFDTAIDYSGALDILWSTDYPDLYGIPNGGVVHVSFKTPAVVGTVYGYVLPDFQIGNWGYDTKYFGGAWTMFGSVPVPQGVPGSLPEPATCLAVTLGCAFLGLRRRR